MDSPSLILSFTRLTSFVRFGKFLAILHQHWLLAHFLFLGLQWHIVHLLTVPYFSQVVSPHFPLLAHSPHFPLLAHSSFPLCSSAEDLPFTCLLLCSLHTFLIESVYLSNISLLLLWLPFPLFSVVGASKDPCLLSPVYGPHLASLWCNDAALSLSMPPSVL